MRTLLLMRGSPGAGKSTYIEQYGLKPYDVAAGAYIVEKAGGIVSDFGGGDNWLHGAEIIAANPRVFDEMVARVKEFLK